MITDTQRLYQFLLACCGNWRNSVYISTDGPGCLLSAGRDGQPIVMAVEQFQQLTGEGFKALYAQYLLWHLPSADTDPFLALTQNDLS